MERLVTGTESMDSVMAVDPKANQNYILAKTIAFATGQQLWVQGIEFKVVSVANGQLTLEPINVKT
jgi:hypothetical protein